MGAEEKQAERESEGIRSRPWTELERYVELGFDPTCLLHQRHARHLFRASAGSATTSAMDHEQLLAAAREELRRHKRSRKMPEQGKAELAAQVLEQEPGEANFPQKLAQLWHDAGVMPPAVTIEYRNLSVEADALVGAGSTPTLGNAFKDLLKKATLQGGLKRQPYGILKNMNGVLRPGSTTLLLGPPGSGKSIFLQALSGRLKTGQHLRVTGSVRYNGVEGRDFVLPRTVALVEQHDYHIPSLTVLETCRFAYQCLENVGNVAQFMATMDKVAARLERETELAELDQHQEDAEAGQVGEDKDVDEASEAKHTGSATSGNSQVYDAEFLSQMRELVKQRGKPQVILKVLGLSDVADTIVGDNMMRGISGGQRKRVTTAEILSGPQAVVLMDEISTGLDSATTFSVVRSFVATAHSLRRTFVISLLQPAPEVVNLFDDVLLLTDGHVMFHGPVSEILPFFERHLDFVCPVRKDVGSFLQEVTTPVGQHAYASPALLKRHGLTEADQDPMKLVTAPPKQLLTPVEVIEDTFWKHSKWGQDALAALDSSPFKPEDGPPHALHRTRYASNWLHLTGLVLRRQFKLNQRDKAFYIARAMQSAIMSLIMASLWATISPTDAQQGRQVISLCSLAVQFAIIMSAPQIGMVFANKRVYYKHRDNHFFPAISYVSSYVITQLPQSFVEMTLFSLILYWISGLTRTADQFFIFWLVLFSISNCMAAFYRLLAYSVKSMIIANSAGALSLLFLMITNGFCIVRGSIPVYLVWVYWMNPISWALRALVSNELDSPRWDVPVEPGSSLSLGKFVADEFDFFLGSKWIWGSVGVSWAALAILTAAGVLAMTVTNPASPKPTVAEEDDEEEVQQRVFSGVLNRASLTLQASGQLSASALRRLPKVLARAASRRLRRPAAPTPAATPAITPAPSGGVEGQAGDAGMERSLSLLEAIEEAGERQERVVVPFEPVTLVIKDIRYYVADPSHGTASGVVKDSDDKEIAGKLELLKGINIYAEPGSLTALMGGSGAGKTTLMDCILGRKTTGLIRGDILVNGHPKEQGPWSRVCGYVEQQDVHSAGATVREALEFSARMRLTEDISGEQVSQVVDETLEMVDLTALQSTIVGEPGEGLSIEQRKRLSIAVELVANPSVVFMDEPTSGLDARAAAIVMRAVKNVSLSNRTVMVTIHQPSMEIFEAFDQLVLLQRGGRLTYFGPLGLESADLVRYLEGQPGVEPIQPGYNPATWMLEVTGGSMSTVFKSSGNDFPTIYAESELFRQNEARARQLVEEGRKTHEPLKLAGVYATSTRTQTLTLTRKWFKLYWRNPNYNFVRFMMTIAIAIVLGLVYLDEGALGPPGSTVSVATVQNIMGLVFVLAVFQGMMNCMSVQPVVAAERLVFYRERASCYYAPLPYAVASGIVELPYLIVQSVLMVVITYWMVGFQRVAWKFFYFLLMYTCSLTMFTFFGQALVFATPNQLLAQLLAGFVNQLWSVFAGFMVPFPVMPTGWKWMNRLSPTTWTLWGLVGSQLADRDDVQIVGYSNQVVPVSTFIDAAFGYSFDMVWWCVLIVAAFCIFFRVSSTLMLRYVNFQRR